MIAIREILGHGHSGDLLDEDGTISRDRGVRIEILGGEGVIEYHGPTLHPLLHPRIRLRPSVPS